MSSFAIKFPRVAGVGHTVSHAKNRRNRTYKYNLHTITVKDDAGKAIRMRLPAKMIRTLKKHGLK